MTIRVPARWCLAAAITTALGIVLAPAVVGTVGVVGLTWAVMGRPRRIGAGVLVCLFLLGGAAGWFADQRSEAVASAVVPEGPAEVVVAIREDPVASTRWMAVGTPQSVDGAPWSGPPMAVGPLAAGIEAGDTIEVKGVVEARVHRVRNDAVAGTIRVRSVAHVSKSSNPFLAVGNTLRDRVRSTFGRDDPVDGLATGLLIGDTERLPARSMEDLRRAGLAHFVAVSGSNVALFLGALWIVGAPIAVHPRLRAVLGLLGLVVFIVVTRWEPSVIRASAMAAIPMVGSLVGVPADPWMALGAAVTILLLVSADLLGSVGFQLSVAATAGVLVGVGLVRHRRPRWLWMPLAATIGAQAAVAPIIVVVFGAIPLVAPLANLMAAPVVTVGSVMGIVAVAVPLGPVVGIARFAAAIVLRVAELASAGPQLSAFGAVGVGILAVGVAWRPLRPVGLAGVALAVLAFVPSGPVWPTTATLVALDVGQGDAIALLDPSGATVLVDGGRDPGVLDRALRRHGIRRVDVLVATHGDADHAGGLVDLIRVGTVGELWIPDHSTDPVLEGLADVASTRSIPVRRVRAGHRDTVGGIHVEVLGPGRRYLADNDGSVVLLVEARSTALLPGDIEAVAQQALPDLRPDVLVVPHHGAGTTDRTWLARTAGPVAVLSYGVNPFGHPHPGILEVLADAGSRVLHTHLEGDVVIPLG